MGRLRKVSSLYSTEPVGFRGQRRFFNAAAEILWSGSAKELLDAVKKIERRGGRTPTFEGGPREIDVDVLDLGGMIRKDRPPILPHPRLAQRRFVLAPLTEIAPRWRHPVLGKTAAELLRELPRGAGVRRLRKTSSDGGGK